MSTRQAMTDGAAAMATASATASTTTRRWPSRRHARTSTWRTLVNHALGTTTALARLARKEPLDPDDPWGSQTDDAGGDWPGRLADRLEATAVAWDDPAAWDGSIDLGGGEQPASVIGEMAFVEVLVHGWDVTRRCRSAAGVTDGSASSCCARSAAPSSSAGRWVRTGRRSRSPPRPPASRRRWPGRPRPELDRLVGPSSILTRDSDPAQRVELLGSKTSDGIRRFVAGEVSDLRGCSALALRQLECRPDRPPDRLRRVPSATACSTVLPPRAAIWCSLAHTR